MKQLMFPDHPTYWFETVRSMSHIAYGGADFGEVLATAGQITPGDPDSWHDAWRATADRISRDAERALAGSHRVSARDGFLRAWNYYRNAEFFLHGDPHDPRILDNYDRATGAFGQYTALAGPDVLRPVRIPFDRAELPGYFYPSPLPGRRPLLLMHSGFDGSAEELHVQGALAAQERGYHVLTFDGPGQPGTRHRHGLLFRPDWEVVVGAVIDWALTLADVDPHRIALLGVSLGGQLCLRAAAFEPRLAAVIAVDGIYDFGAAITAPLGEDGGDGPDIAEAGLRADSAPHIDAALEQAAEDSDTARWALAHGRYVMGGATPREFLARTLDYHLRDGIAEAITCPVLVCEAENDLFFAGQPEQVLAHLTTGDKTLMVFTEAEGADAHCHAGAQRHAVARIHEWLDERVHPEREGAVTSSP
ncbi:MULTISPECIES: alpha/beta fold hydrolase [unclassified Streptomyces]|uniref:alpha/beta hydrolase family protein n=1 Tax=unclassified Streptomyces TaxID=2593676 RepID=UPI0033A464FF